MRNLPTPFPKVMISLPTQNDRSVQVVETIHVDENGGQFLKLEVLIEGDVIEKEGRKFKVVKNKNGCLYKKSISPMGQVGQPQPMSIAEKNEYERQMIEAAFPGDRAAAFLAALEKAQQNPIKPKAVSVNEIHDLWLDAFTPETREALSRRVATTLEGANVNGEKRLNIAIYGSVRIVGRKHRDQSILRLIEIMNELGRRGWLRGCLAPLSSMAVPVVGATASFLEAPEVIRVDELVFLFPLVPVEHRVEIEASFPGIFFPEGHAAPAPLNFDI